MRFAISPLVEARRSLRVLDDPGGGALHLPWAVEARRLTAGLDLSLLRALDPADVYTPDFVSPPPTSPLADFEDQLAVVAATPPEQALAEVQRSYRRKPAMPAVLEPFVEDPAAGVAAVADLLRAYWDRALAPHWPRVRALLEGDVLHRARQMADGGAERLFADVDPTVSWADGILEHRQASGAGRRPRGARAAVRPQRLHVAGRRARDRSALAADASSIRRAGWGRCGTPGAQRRPTPSARCSGRCARPC